MDAGKGDSPIWPLRPRGGAEGDSPILLRGLRKIGTVPKQRLVTISDRSKNVKIYTKTGDDGSTGLFGGPRVDKDDPRIEAYGTVDELNSTLGWARAVGLPADLDELIRGFKTSCSRSALNWPRPIRPLMEPISSARRRSRRWSRPSTATRPIWPRSDNSSCPADAGGGGTARCPHGLPASRTACGNAGAARAGDGRAGDGDLSEPPGRFAVCRGPSGQSSLRARPTCRGKNRRSRGERRGSAVGRPLFTLPACCRYVEPRIGTGISRVRCRQGGSWGGTPSGGHWERRRAESRCGLAGDSRRFRRGPEKRVRLSRPRRWPVGDRRSVCDEEDRGDRATFQAGRREESRWPSRTCTG